MKFLPFYCNYIVVCDNIILHKLLGKLGAKMKKFTGFLAIFMVVLLCVPSFTAVFADTYSSSVSTVQDGNESESSTDNTTDNVQTYPYDLEEGIYKIKYQNKVLTGVSSEQNGGQTFIFADEQESDEQLFCFEKLEQDKYKIVQQSSQKVLTAQDNTAVFSDWNDDETQYWSLVSTEEGTVFLKSYNHQMVVVSSENTLQLSYNMPDESFSFERAVNSYSTNSNVENTVDSQEKQTLNSAQQKDVVIPDGYYEIRSAVSGKNLEVYGVSTLGGAKITQWYATGGKNQKWKVENQADGSVRITNVNSGLVLDYNGSVNAYEQWDWHGGSNQRWEISKTSTEGNYCIRNQSNGYAMDVLYGTMEDGQHVVSYEYNGGVNQQWQFIKTDCNATQVVPDGYYEIKSAVSGKDLEVYGASLLGGGKVTQWDATGGNNQKWKLENQSDGTIRLTNVNSGLVLDYNASTNSYEQWDWHGGSNQRWQISKSQAGNYYIRNMSNNHAMDVLYGNTGNGQYVVDYEYNGGINQQWQLVPTTIEQIIPDGYYEIRSAVSGKNLEVYGVSMLSGAKITQWYATGGKNQKWKVENQDDGNVRITNVNSGLVLEYNGNTNAYEQRNWNGGSNQKWEISKTSTEGNYCIRNQSNGYAMDVLYGAMEDGDHVVSYEYNGGVNQQWQFIQTDPDTTQVVPDGYYEIKSAVSGKNLEVYGASTQGGAKITQWDATGGNNQKWKLENQSDGTIRLTNVNSGLVLDYNASTNSYEQWDWHGGSNQRWQISKSQAGNYYIRNMSNNHAMDVLYGSMNNGQYVVDYEYNGGINQQWQLVPVELKTLQGIDVSEHQGNINWQQVKASGQVDFAIIRAGYGRETYQKDKFFEQNYAGAKAQNIPIGIYQYSYADSVADAEREAETCLTWLNGRAVDSYVIFDFEESKIIKEHDITPDVLSQMAIAWCKKIEAAGYTPMIYVNPDFITNKYNYKMLKESGYDIWIANYGRSITYDWPYPVRMWQYTSSGSVSGISTNVDMNIMYTGSEYSGKFVLPDGQKGKCNSSNVNVRTSPTTTSGNNVLFQVHNGYQFTILQEQNGWYQVSFGADRIGWISGLYVTLI